MPIGPDGTVVEGPSSDDDTGAVGGAEKEAEGHGGTKPVGGAGARPHARNAVLDPRSYR